MWAKEETPENIFYKLLSKNKFTKTDRRCIKFHKETDSNAFYVLIETGENREYPAIDLVRKLLGFLKSSANNSFEVILEPTALAPYTIYEARKSYTTYMIRLLKKGEKEISSRYASSIEVLEILKKKCPALVEHLKKKSIQKSYITLEGEKYEQ